LMTDSCCWSIETCAPRKTLTFRFRLSQRCDLCRRKGAPQRGCTQAAPKLSKNKERTIAYLLFLTGPGHFIPGSNPLSDSNEEERGECEAYPRGHVHAREWREIKRPCLRQKAGVSVVDSVFAGTVSWKVRNSNLDCSSRLDK
jgi:hypothetical protein